MAWISMDFSSKTLKRPVELEILIPQSGSISRVLFLLHGARDNRMAWLMKSQMEYFAENKNICVVMPDGMNSFYVNTHNSYHFMDFICEELPTLLKNMYYLPEDKNLWMIAGNDCGGYGALRCGLQAANTFGYIASFSAPLHMEALYDHCSFANMWNVFGEKEHLPASENNLYELTKKHSAWHHSKILLTCGKQDELFAENQDLYQHLMKQKENSDSPNNAPITFLSKDGKHDWCFWNDSLKYALEWFCA